MMQRLEGVVLMTFQLLNDIGAIVVRMRVLSCGDKELETFCHLS